MPGLAKLFIHLSVAAFSLISAPAFADNAIEFKSFLCTSALNAPSGVTTIKFTGRNPLNGKDSFILNNVPVAGIPYSQVLLLTNYKKSGSHLQLNFFSVATKTELTLSMNSATHSIQLITSEAAQLEMTCQANINIPN